MNRPAPTPRLPKRLWAARNWGPVIGDQTGHYLPLRRYWTRLVARELMLRDVTEFNPDDELSVLKWTLRRRRPLSVRQAQVYDLYFLGGKKLTEISRLMGIGLSTVETHLRRLRRRMNGYLYHVRPDLFY